MLRHTEIPGHGPGDFAGHIGSNSPAAAWETVEDADCSAEWPGAVQLMRHGWRPLYNIGRFRLRIVPWSPLATLTEPPLGYGPIFDKTPDAQVPFCSVRAVMVSALYV